MNLINEQIRVERRKASCHNDMKQIAPSMPKVEVNVFNFHANQTDTYISVLNCLDHRTLEKKKRTRKMYFLLLRDYQTCRQSQCSVHKVERS